MSKQVLICEFYKNIVLSLPKRLGEMTLENHILRYSFKKEPLSSNLDFADKTWGLFCSLKNKNVLRVNTFCSLMYGTPSKRTSPHVRQ